MISTFNRLFALLFGLALAAAAFIAVVNGVAVWGNSGFVWIPGRRWLAAFRSTPWSAPTVVVISAAVAAFGLVLLIIQTWPTRRRLVQYETDAPGEWVLLRRSAEAHLRRSLSVAGGGNGSLVKARLDARSSRWSLDLHTRAGAPARPTLESDAADRLAELHAPPFSRVRVRTIARAAAPPMSSAAPMSAVDSDAR